jgi:hypothetical protein
LIVCKIKTFGKLPADLFMEAQLMADMGKIGG